MNRTVIVTGSSRGIGRATAELFASKHYNVVINYHRSREEALELAGSLTRKGGRAVAVGADVSTRVGAEKLAETALSEFGAVDVLVHNAGIAQQKLFTDLTEADWDAMMDVHLKGLFHCCQCVLPGMIHRKSGCIVTVSSIWGICGASCEVHYSAAKAGVVGFTKALAKEVGPSGIRVNCVAPGIIDTRMNAVLTETDRAALIEETPLQKFGAPSDIADAVYFLASESGSFITGQVLSPNGGFVI